LLPIHACVHCSFGPSSISAAPICTEQTSYYNDCVWPAYLRNTKVVAKSGILRGTVTVLDGAASTSEVLALAVTTVMG
jgi:hypothetical protein